MANTGGNRRGKVLDPSGDRRRVARFLAEHGPTHGDDAAAALGLTLARWWELVNTCPWFAIAGGGWTLSERGRAEALDPGAA